MSRHTKFQCDVTGEWYGAKNAGDGVLEFEIRRHIHGSPFEIQKRLVHISHDKLDEEAGSLIPTGIEYVGVEEGEVVGALIMRRDSNNDRVGRYKERDDVTIDHYEPFFEYVEDEVLY